MAYQLVFIGLRAIDTFTSLADCTQAMLTWHATLTAAGFTGRLECVAVAMAVV